ncbi:MAG: hypothetical protein RLZZ170_1011, partial [Actinomycetota bacterium]
HKVLGSRDPVVRLDEVMEHCPDLCARDWRLIGPSHENGSISEKLGDPRKIAGVNSFGIRVQQIEDCSFISVIQHVDTVDQLR